jgi:hypothetical protein
MGDHHHFQVYRMGLNILPLRLLRCRCCPKEEDKPLLFAVKEGCKGGSRAGTIKYKMKENKIVQYDWTTTSLLTSTVSTYACLKETDVPPTMRTGTLPRWVPLRLAPPPVDLCSGPAPQWPFPPLRQTTGLPLSLPGA